MRDRLCYTRLLATVLLAAWLPACSTYQVMADPSAGLQPAPGTPEQVRVTLASGTQFALKSPVIYGDTLRGFSAQKKPMSVAMADVTKVEVPKPSTSKTVLAVVGVAVVAGVVVGAILLANSNIGI